MSVKGMFLSIALHGGAFAVLNMSIDEQTRPATKIVVRREQPKPKKVEQPHPPPEDPPPPPKKKQEIARPKAPIVPEHTAPPVPSDTKPEPTTPARRPVDLGLALGNDAPSGEGLSVPMSNREAKLEKKPRAVKPRVEPVRKETEDLAACTEEPSKPKPSERTEIVYPVEARAAGIAGRLVLKVYVREDGTVERVEVLQGLGEELEGPVIAAVERWRFDPARACGKPVAGTYTLARRFELGD